MLLFASFVLVGQVLGLRVLDPWLLAVLAFPFQGRLFLVLEQQGHHDRFRSLAHLYFARLGHLYLLAFLVRILLFLVLDLDFALEIVLGLGLVLAIEPDPVLDFALVLELGLHECSCRVLLVA